MTDTEDSNRKRGGTKGSDYKHSLRWFGTSARRSIQAVSPLPLLVILNVFSWTTFLSALSEFFSQKAGLSAAWIAMLQQFVGSIQDSKSKQ